MLIRNAQEKDFAACFMIAKEAWPEFKERMAIYRVLCKFFTNTCFVCEQEGEIQGFLLGFLSQVNCEEAYIHLVVVKPSVQHTHIGSNLYQTFFETVRTFGARRVRLTVRFDNAVSLAFHEKMGFKPDIQTEEIRIGSILAAKDFYGSGEHMIPFCRSLD